MEVVKHDKGGATTPPNHRIYFDGQSKEGLPIMKATPTSGGIINNIFDKEKTPLDSIIDYDQTNKKTLKAFRRQWLRNTRTNAKNYPNMGKDNSLGKYSGYLRDKPSIMVGAGPSLKKNGHLLKDCGLTILTVMHALPYLEKIGVTPDFVVQADAMATDHEFITESSKDITLIAMTLSAPKVIRKWKGPVVFFNGLAGGKFIQKLNDMTTADVTLRPMGCSMASAMSIAEELMGSNQIIFIGNDLSYDRNYTLGGEGVGKNMDTHVWDGLDYNTNEFAGVAPLLTEGTLKNKKKRIYSCYQFILYRRNIQMYAQGRRWRPPYKRFINATEGGILLLPETMTLKKALKSVADTTYSVNEA